MDCTQSQEVHSLNTSAMQHLLHLGKRSMTASLTAAAHPHIPEHLRSSIFPLYMPNSIDLVVFWEIPGQSRRGYLLVTGIVLGATHALFREVI